MHIELPSIFWRKRFQAGVLLLTVLAGGAATTLLPPVRPAMLPVPVNIADGSTVLLACGTLYQGTLNLQGRRGVTVKTAGNCGNARISPGRAVDGWTQVRAQVYAAPIGFVPAQVALDGVPLSRAHWPNRPWAAGTAGMPSQDLAGATLVVLVNQSVIQAYPMPPAGIDTTRPFYVEGKLWMLDSPGEWAVDNGRLYVWAPDGRSPARRVWAAPDANGIDADGSQGVVIDNVAIFAARDGISANGSVNLTVRDTDIRNTSRDGIWASGSHGLHVHGTTVANARRNGIDGWYAISGAVVTDSRVTDTGMAGMPSPSDAGILFGAGSDNRIERVHVTRSAYHGINVMRNRHSLVGSNTVGQACLRLSDCGAIYTSARDGQPLALRIEGNTVTGNQGEDVIGIYLDDGANVVTVSGNTVSHNQRGLVIHDGYDTTVSHNTFAASTVVHIGLSQSRGAVRDVRITDNVFTSTQGEQTFNLEGGGDLLQYATYDRNTYVSSHPAVFGHAWDGQSAALATDYPGWLAWMGQDVHSRAVMPAEAGTGSGGSGSGRSQGQGSLTAP
jgi:parallel beta-helix repeat protein